MVSSPAILLSCFSWRVRLALINQLLVQVSGNIKLHSPGVELMGMRDVLLELPKVLEYLVLSGLLNVFPLCVFLIVLVLLLFLFFLDPTYCPLDVPSLA